MEIRIWDSTLTIQQQPADRLRKADAPSRWSPRRAWCPVRRKAAHIRHTHRMREEGDMESLGESPQKKPALRWHPDLAENLLEQYVRHGQLV